MQNVTIKADNNKFLTIPKGRCGGNSSSAETLTGEGDYLYHICFKLESNYISVHLESQNELKKNDKFK